MENFKFTEKHLSLVLGIPVILIGVSYFILLIYYGMDSDLNMPKFYEWSQSFYKDFINIVTGIVQFSISGLLIIKASFWINSAFERDKEKNKNKTRGW